MELRLLVTVQLSEKPEDREKIRQVMRDIRKIDYVESAIVPYWFTHDYNSMILEASEEPMHHPECNCGEH